MRHHLSGDLIRNIGPHRMSPRFKNYHETTMRRILAFAGENCDVFFEADELRDIAAWRTWNLNRLVVKDQQFAKGRSNAHRSIHLPPILDLQVNSDAITALNANAAPVQIDGRQVDRDRSLNRRARWILVHVDHSVAPCDTLTLVKPLSTQDVAPRHGECDWPAARCSPLDVNIPELDCRLAIYRQSRGPINFALLACRRDEQQSRQLRPYDPPQECAPQS